MFTIKPTEVLTSTFKCLLSTDPLLSPYLHPLTPFYQSHIGRHYHPHFAHRKTKVQKVAQSLQTSKWSSQYWKLGLFGPVALFRVEEELKLEIWDMLFGLARPEVWALHVRIPT